MALSGAPPGMGGFMPMGPAIRGVLFDKDGTLFDFQATWGAWARDLILAESGGDRGRAGAMADAIGFDLARARFRPGSMAVASTTAEVGAALLPQLPGERLDALVARMDARAADLPVLPVAPLRPILLRLRAMGVALGVATNDGEAPARAHLRAAGIDDLVPFVAGFDSGWGGKPAPGQLLAFAAWAGLPPAACAMVGDSLHDLHAARAAGMAAVAVLTGLAGEGELGPHADAVLASVAGLPGWVEGLGATDRVASGLSGAARGG